jgi:hypothetical protein
MASLFSSSLKDNIPIMFFIGFAFITALQSSPPEATQHTLNGNAFFQQAMAQQQQQPQPSTSNSQTSKNWDSQNKSGNMIEASGHFSNNQLKDGVVTWIQGGYWNLQIIDASDNNNNQTSNNNNNSNNTAVFWANFTMIKPDGSLSHSHTISNFSSNMVILSDNDIVVTGIADINSDNGLEYKQVPLIVHLMGKKVLGLTIDVSKTGGHFAGQNEMFGTLISGVGINRSNSTAATMNHDKPLSNETPMAMMQH